MKDLLQNLDRSSFKIVKRLSAAAREEGVNLYLVGGIVRDLSLGRPNVDLDFVVEADAGVLVKKWEKELHFTNALLYQPFKTVTLFIDGRRVDVASARRESYPYPGALPGVSLGNIQEDLFRRDFTINAMALDLSKKDLVDPYNGLKDLKGKEVRILHDQSFRDDPTRILRAVRFEQRFGFQIEPQTLRLLKLALRDDYPSTVKPPRYFAEFVKILKEDKPSLGLRRLYELRGLGFFGEKIKINWKALVRLEKKLPCQDLPNGWQLYLMALLQDVPLPALKRMFERFPIPRLTQKSILEIRNKSDIIKLSQKQMRPSQVYRLLRDLSPESLLYWRITLAHPRVSARIDLYENSYSKIKLNLNGHDILRFGVKESHRVKTILDQLLDAKIDGKIKSKRGEIALAKTLIAK